jgi:hypothetical protein
MEESRKFTGSAMTPGAAEMNPCIAERRNTMPKKTHCDGTSSRESSESIRQKQASGWYQS